MTLRPMWLGGHAMAGLAGFAVLATAVSCREPTEVLLVVTTDVPCTTVAATHPEIAVGSRTTLDDGTAQRTQTEACSGSQIGSLAIVPSEADDVVAISVALSTRAGKDSSTCHKDPTDCIVARRVLRFVTHRTLTLPVDLSFSCVDKACGPEQTCVAGVCVSDTVDTHLCKNDVCGSTTLPPADGGAPEGGPADAASDACTMCAGSCIDLAIDPKNCGGCGVDCSGGECIAGNCRLTPKVSLADATGDLGCVAVAVTSGGEDVSWVRTKAPAAIYHVPSQGGPASALYAPGGNTSLGTGIDARGAFVAFDAVEAASNLSLLFCDPTLPPSACTKRTIAGSAPSPFVAMDGEANRAAYLTSGGKIVSTTAAHDRSGAYTGFVATAKGQLAAIDTSSGNAIHIIELATDIIKTASIIQGAPQALVGDPQNPRFFVASGKAVSLATVNGIAPLYSGLVGAPRLLALRAGVNAELFWVVPESASDVIYRAPATGSGTPTRFLAVAPAGSIACLAVGKDAVYWTQSGVGWKHGAP